MVLINCPECAESISDKAVACPKCGYPVKPMAELPQVMRLFWRGFQWRSKVEILGWPLVHVAIGRDKETGKLLVAKGIIAIGQFGIGLITIAQFGIGFFFAFGQFTGGLLAVGQVALGVYFGLGQFATGMTAIGQLAFGKYVLAQMGIGEHVWSPETKDPVAIEYFRNLWEFAKNLFHAS
jgi:hypothetical protein